MTIYCLKCNGEGHTHIIVYMTWVLPLADFICKIIHIIYNSIFG